MKIRSIVATPVNIPLVAPIVWSVGLYPGTSKTIIEVVTEDGIVGLGEAPSSDCAHLINEAIAPKLIGKNPLDIAGCE
jgi:glucarate dehydratase